MKYTNPIPAIITAVIFSFSIFSASEANAQSANKKESATVTKQNVQSPIAIGLGTINAEILALEKELANIELVAKQNNIDLGTSWSYMILNKTVASNDEKATAKN